MLNLDDDRMTMGRLRRLVPQLDSVHRSRTRHQAFHALFVVVLLLGVIARIWEFGTLPPGLNQDEAQNAVDAYSLLHYGVDRNGVSWPVEFISYGSGASALYGYILIPFIAVLGLTPVVVRLPMLLSGILSLPLLFYVGTRLGGRQFGLVVMLLLTISPWHIMATRWGHEGNFLPFVFLAGYVCLLESTSRMQWFIPAACLSAMCLYAYGPSYAAVPIFLALAIPTLLLTGKLGLRLMSIGLASFAVLAAPIGLFLLINALKLDTIHLGLLTIPRLPVQPRFETQSALFNDQMFHTLKANATAMASLLWTQGDDLPWNSVAPYGYFYRYTLPLAAFGAWTLIPLRGFGASVERLLLLAWLAASGATGFLQPANINRINLIFIPLLLCVAASMDWLGRRSKAVLVATVCAFLLGFGLFTRAYHGDRYRMEANIVFYNGFLQALEYARGVTDNSICVTSSGVREPYIFVLFLEKMDPTDYLPTIVYEDPQAEFRHVTHLGRYSFGLSNCTDQSDDTLYVLNRTELAPHAELYRARAFGNFIVYLPRTSAPQVDGTPDEVHAQGRNP